MKISRLIKIALIYLILIGNSLWAIDDKIQEIEEAIKETRIQFKQDPTQAIQKLRSLSKQFDLLEDKPQMWEKSLAGRKIYQWDNQTPKQAIGGALFYPSNIEKLLDSPYTIALVNRNDIVWSLTLAAKYEDPRGQYYLSYVLSERMQGHDHTVAIPGFIENLYHAAREKFTKAIQGEKFNPQALYILAYDDAFKEVRIGRFTPQGIGRAEQYFNSILQSDQVVNGEAKRSSFQLLRMKKKYAKGYYNNKKPPSLNDYETAAQLYKFGPIFEEAAKLCKDQNKKRKLLEEATDNNYFESYISLGLWSLQEKKEESEAEKFFLTAAYNGITQGYVMAGILKLRDGSAKYLKKLYPHLIANGISKQEEVKRALEYFETAGNEGDPQGWDKLVSVYESLYHIIKQESKEKNNKKKEQKREFIQKIKEGIEKGLSLGDDNAYRRLEFYTSSLFSLEESKALIEKYGKPPYDNLWEDIKNFIEEETTKGTVS